MPNAYGRMLELETPIRVVTTAAMRNKVRVRDPILLMDAKVSAVGCLLHYATADVIDLEHVDVAS